MTLKQLSSSITTSALAQDLKTSTQAIENGGQMLSATAQSKALEALTDPTKNIAMINRRLIDGVSSLVQLKVRYSSDHDIRGFDILGNPTAEDIDRCLRMVTASLVPLPLTEIKQRLTSMMILLAIPKDFDADVLELKRDALAAKLSEWPADAVIDAIGYIERNCKFMPSLAEFVEHMSWQIQPRKLLLKELENYIVYRTSV